VTEEFGDFSHYRPVGSARDVAAWALPPHTPAAQTYAAAAAAAERYFDGGYPGIAWKITEGVTYEDPTWRGAYDTAVRRGRWFLGYHFDRAVNDGAAQFDWFISRLLNGAGGRLRPGGVDRLCLDSEDVLTPSRARASAVAFTRRATMAGHPDGCVYSAPWFDSHTRPNTVRLDLLPVGWRVGWVPDYTPGEPDDQIELPDGWARGQVWARQYTDTRPGLPGLPMGCDFNRTLRPWPGTGDASMSAAELAALTQQLADLKAYQTSDTMKAMVRQEVITALSDPTHQYLQDELAPLKAGLASTAQQLTGLTSQLAAVTSKVAALSDDETRILAAVAQSQAAMQAAVADAVREIAGQGGNPGDPGFPAQVADAVMARFRTAFNQPGPTA
jgi:glycosyl hydrolase family 25